MQPSSLRHISGKLARKTNLHIYYIYMYIACQKTVLQNAALKIHQMRTPKSKSSSRSITRNFTPLRHTPRAPIKSECLSLRNLFSLSFFLVALPKHYLWMLWELNSRAIFHFRLYAKLMALNYQRKLAAIQMTPGQVTISSPSGPTVKREVKIRAKKSQKKKKRAK